MKNKILSAIISIVLMISLVGCQQNNKIIRPDVETKTVTENSQEDYVTFSLDVPSDWKVLTQDYVSIACFSSKANETNANDKISPYKLSIDNYIIPSLMPIDDKYKQASLIPLLGAGFFPYMQKNTAQAAAAAQKKMQYAEHTASFYISIPR